MNLPVAAVALLSVLGGSERPNQPHTVPNTNPAATVVIRPGTNHNLMKNALKSLAPVARPEIISEADAKEGGPRWYGIPSRWMDSGNLRCSAGHVMRVHASITSDKFKGMVCAVCGNPVWITFPEDKSAGKELVEVEGWVKQRGAK